MNNQLDRARNAGMQSQTGAASTAPRPATQVETYCRELAESIDGLEKAIDRHAEKIEPVLRVQDPSKGDTMPPDEMLVPVADKIRSQVRRVIYLRERMENLTVRAEA